MLGAYCPDWYPLVKAARYLGVPPWELAKQPRWWRDVALIAESAEQSADAEMRARSANSQSNVVPFRRR